MDIVQILYGMHAKHRHIVHQYILRIIDGKDRPGRMRELLEPALRDKYLFAMCVDLQVEGWKEFSARMQAGDRDKTVAELCRVLEQYVAAEVPQGPPKKPGLIRYDPPDMHAAKKILHQKGK